MRIADLGNLPNLRGEQLHVYMECASRMKYFAEHNLDIIRESVDDENYSPDILDDDAVDAINEQRPMVLERHY
ncbi:hypothetical protein Pmar_PMAR015887 [Perkinsus marinus ATCC 50983]|uniref:Uncharacterized protein n=1 Tax=Perkinsus marinus (strain ATCC 50983 / TXsc) TaxID=423536 RepID=C5M1L9_PERM5|nr:hypothetical protein Pmar_PMAR015887 [Perkinsus marinus ATCC 50983]EEQ97123.1 hypothetical protein Pmar_PMAR015887 [Perkinsus marinus ATCC 50983]|eukprot:XP_002764406.1 hypothetical protein Pmar_PMAR015887 [Perkinsus marinus ATCC 50983]